MNKKEQKVLENARIEAALSWPKYNKPEPMPQGYGIKVGGFHVHGWAQVNCRVEPGKSEYTRHYTGTNSVGTQGSRATYATELEALRVARWQLSESVARELYKIDERIRILESEVTA